MSKLEIKHIEYLQEMVNHKNEGWANEAYKELAAIKSDLESKGIFLI